MLNVKLLFLLSNLVRYETDAPDATVELLYCRLPVSWLPCEGSVQLRYPMVLSVSCVVSFVIATPVYSHDGDTCAIDYPALGTTLASGTGTATYTYSAYALAAGTYSSFYANDTTSATTSLRSFR